MATDRKEWRKFYWKPRSTKDRRATEEDVSRRTNGENIIGSGDGECSAIVNIGKMNNESK
jgi:hypothetical protein